jgi:hypothetical protein
MVFPQLAKADAACMAKELLALPKDAREVPAAIERVRQKFR